MFQRKVWLYKTYRYNWLVAMVIADNAVITRKSRDGRAEVTRWIYDVNVCKDIFKQPYINNIFFVLYIKIMEIIPFLKISPLAENPSTLSWLDEILELGKMLIIWVTLKGRVIWKTFAVFHYLNATNVSLL